MKQVFLGFGIGLALGTTVMAVAVKADEAVKPSYANQIIGLQKRCNGIVERSERLTDVVNQQSFRIQELERKVSGMQKQITILHAKGSK